jgi:carbon-monoxide dehydrogenase medium subunit
VIPATFAYRRAASVDEALRLLGESDGDARLLAGGHSLLPAMKLRLDRPGTLIDISRIDELTAIAESGGGVCIGAAATHDRIAACDLVGARAPLVAAAAAVIGDVQVRNKGTIGGSVAHADPAADYPAALLASDAVIHVRGPATNGEDGSRQIAAADFFVDLYATALEDGEIVTAVEVPDQDGAGSSYQKFPHPASRFAVCGAAVSVATAGGRCTSARVALNGVATAAFRDAGVEASLEGATLDSATIEAAAAKAADGRELLSDLFADEDYRRHLAKVFVRRALTAAVG